MLHFILEGELPGKLDLEDLSWLEIMKIIKGDSTSTLENDGPEILPGCDDFELTLENLVSVRKFCKDKINIIR